MNSFILYLFLTSCVEIVCHVYVEKMVAQDGQAATHGVDTVVFRFCPGESFGRHVDTFVPQLIVARQTNWKYIDEKYSVNMIAITLSLKIF